MTDEELINLITNNGQLKYVSLRYINKIKQDNICLYNEIINRYNDADSIKEILFRLKNHIDIRPTCKYCGNHVKFINDKGDRHWQEYCSQTCLHSDKKHWDKCKATCFKKYSDSSYRNIQQAKQTKLEKYGDKNYNNIIKSRQTRKMKYGEWQSPNNIEAVKNKSENTKLNQVIKTKQTKLERYGDPTFVNPEKAKHTCLEKYGVEYTGQIPSKIKKTIHTNQIKYGGNAPASSIIIQKKIKQTCLEKYGTEFIFQSEQIKEKIKTTCLEKYNVDNILKLDSIKSKNTNTSKDARTKAKETSLTRFGHTNYNNRKKAQQTCLEKYGVTNKRKLKESKEHMSQIMRSIDVQRKRNNTLRKNNSFNKSKPEEESYILLKERYSDIIRQYKSDVYPFACDFYIPSLDLYIECNYHWTHGGKLFEGSNEDSILLDKWKNKNTKYYDSAIHTWTQLDVRKYKTAKENNLNYLLFYNINELKTWLDNYEVK